MGDDMAKAKKYYKKYDKSYPITDKKFQKILAFFLFECPTPGTSQRAKDFSQLGWSGSPQFSNLKKRLIGSASSSLRSNYYPCKKDDLPEKFRIVESVSPVDEYCVFLKNGEKTVMYSLFSAIRNAFAHGSFAVQSFNDNGSKVKVYFFCNYHDYLKAEIILQESTLLKWIEIVKSGYDPTK